MSLQSSGSSHPLLSCTDGIATGMYDALLLIGRVLIALLFLLTAWFGSPNAGYLTSLGYPNPDMMSTLAIVVEWIIIISLVLGLGTRYGALLGLLFVVIAAATAHRYWTYPQAAQGVQYIFLTKDIAIAGGLVLLFATGGGRFSVDRQLSGKS
jgi:putative oxidoreductase